MNLKDPVPRSLLLIILTKNMLAAILFDLDGTIVNTDHIHYQAWQQMLKSYGQEIDQSFYKSHISGRTNSEIVKDLLPELSEVDGQKLAEQKEALFRQLAPNLELSCGFDRVLAWTETHQLKRALVTNAPKFNAEFMLEVLGVKAAFHTIVLAEDCVAGKPDPAPYQAALQNLGISAAAAIALEDSPTGIRSAVSANIRTIGITSTHTPQVLAEFGAMIAISDFTDLQLWTLLNSCIEENKQVIRTNL